MQDQSNKAAIKAVSLSVGLSLIIYIVLSMLGIYMFGSAVKADLMDNIG